MIVLRWALACLVLGATNVACLAAKTQSPIQKVVSLLLDVRTKLMLEAEQEAQTYDKFACFCKDEMAEKAQAISDNQNDKGVVETDLVAASQARDAQDTNIATTVGAIAGLQQEIEDLTKQRHEGLMQYKKVQVDLVGAIGGLEGAIHALQAAQTATALSQLKPGVGALVRRACSIAQGLGTVNFVQQDIDKALATISLLESGSGLAHHAQQGLRGLHRDVPDSVYEFRSGTILSTLQDLKTTFKAKLSELDTQETTSREEFDSLVQTKETSIGNHKLELDGHKESKAAEAVRVAALSKDLTSISAQLMADQNVLASISSECNTKAVLWDSRSSARATELGALTQVLGIMQTMANATEATQMVQLSHRHDAAPKHQQHVTLHQRRKDHPKRFVSRGADLGQRARVRALLLQAASKSHSVELLQLARRVAEDPFAKVKTMIQNLIEKLLREAAEEADHKAWCDSEVAMAEQKRDHNAQTIAQLNNDLTFSEAQRAQIAEVVKQLQIDLVEINETLANQSDLRVQEELESNASIADAQENNKTVAEAITILTQFYAAARQNQTALAQINVHAMGTSSHLINQSIVADPAPSAPDAGFDGAYTGASDAVEGIIGMLEVIRSDFERTIVQTQQAEKQAEQEFQKLEGALLASSAEKTVVLQDREKALNASEVADADSRKSMQQHQSMLDKELQELEALRSACSAGGLSPEEKKAKREQEIESLHSVLCILGSHATGGAALC